MTSIATDCGYRRPIVVRSKEATTMSSAQTRFCPIALLDAGWRTCGELATREPLQWKAMQAHPTLN